MTLVPVGVDAKYFAKVETNFDEFGRLTSASADSAALRFVSATDWVPLNDLKFKPFLKFSPSKEHLGTASLANEIRGKQGGTWMCSFYSRPKAVGTPPDVGEILRGAFGTETISAGVSVTYALNSLSPKSLVMARYSGAGLFEGASGMWAEDISVEIVGNTDDGETLITISGGFATYFCCSQAVGSTDPALGATAVTLNAASQGHVMVGARIALNADDNNPGTGALGYLVTAVSSAGVVTFTPGLLTEVTANPTITPFVPATTTLSDLGGTILGGVDCGCSVDTLAIGMISGKTTIKTGYHGMNKEATATRPKRAARAKREVMVDMQFYLLDTDNADAQSASAPASLVGQAWNGTLHAITMRAGSDIAGQRMKVVHPANRLNVSEIDLPEAEEAQWKTTGPSRMTTVVDNEVSLVFD